jgi:hypothetical protein
MSRPRGRRRRAARGRRPAPGRSADRRRSGHGQRGRSGGTGPRGLPGRGRLSVTRSPPGTTTGDEKGLPSARPAPV